MQVHRLCVGIFFADIYARRLCCVQGDMLQSPNYVSRGEGTSSGSCSRAEWGAVTNNNSSSLRKQLRGCVSSTSPGKKDTWKIGSGRKCLAFILHTSTRHEIYEPHLQEDSLVFDI